MSIVQHDRRLAIDEISSPIDSYNSISDSISHTQLHLFRGDPDYTPLKSLLIRRFGGYNVCISEIEEYILAETSYRLLGCRENVLQGLQASSHLSVLSDDSWAHEDQISFFLER